MSVQMEPVSRKQRNKSENISVTLGDDLRPRVVAIAEKLGISVPDVIRMGLRAGLPSDNKNRESSDMARRALEVAL